jgi:Fe-S-cluster containining protein
MNDLLNRYAGLLTEVDEWFRHCQRIHPDYIACGKGCSACCRGLFDITLMDALNCRRGFDLLSGEIQVTVRLASSKRLSDLTQIRPEFTTPWIINRIPEEQWHEIMPEDDGTPCVFLSNQGTCLIYDFRPMTCRLNGIPLIDVSGEGMSEEWCTLNFVGIDPEDVGDISYHFKELFTQELLLLRELTRRIYGNPVNELDTILPAVAFYEENLVNSIRLPELS